MIYDTFAHIDMYRGLGANMDRAIEHLKQTDLSGLPAGRYEVDGANVYLMIQEPEFRAPADAQFEAHRRYADIQLALADGEAIACLPVEKVEKWEPFDAEKDIGFSDTDEKGTPLPMPGGTFMILFPQDAHMPNLKCGSAATGRKAVVKVLLENGCKRLGPHLQR